ncbi:MAG: hypothetical protein CSA58_10145 [Micrococcales bacterium]|nr:MAG: hypothetical protein CSA58_10145 [Micrococcales bacterium]
MSSVTTTASARPARPTAAEPVRKDIQALRAIAVGVVILGHLWPHRMPGGRVGVDVFFVISGFLITSHLMRRPPVTWPQLADFWARRIRRLLPAAALVLATSLAAAVLWLPQAMRSRAALEAAAASVYVENWAKVWVEADPVRSAEQASPLQHYWSLSVEEQFYIVWPLLLAATIIIGRRMSKNLVPVVALCVVAVSFLISVYTTASAEAVGYFGTHVRMWELAAGAALAVWVGRGFASEWHAGLRTVVSWAGLAMIAASALFLTFDYPFPGPWAALPVLGAVLVIAADSDATRWGGGRVLGIRPITYLGDISYSLYLWHWPVIVIAPFALGYELDMMHRIGILGLVLVLSVLSREFVEEKLRHQRGIVSTIPRSFAMGVVCIVSVLLLAAGVAVAS